LRFSDWLHTKVGRQHGIALPRLTELLFTYLTLEMGHAPQLVLDSLARDYQRGGRRDLPPLWRAQPVEEKPAEGERRPKLPAKRQRKHLA
jgi:hypothetical protein